MRRAAKLASDQPPDRRNDPAATGRRYHACWQQLRSKARLTIINQANDMIGLTPFPTSNLNIRLIFHSI
jgi:hypothetical protein